jgi:hypothetical protein
MSCYSHGLITPFPDFLSYVVPKFRDLAEFVIFNINGSEIQNLEIESYAFQMCLFQMSQLWRM